MAPTVPIDTPAAEVLPDVTLRLSVIIVNWNTLELLRACLASMRDYVEHPECEIIVVDNASRDGSPDMVESEFPAVRLLRMTDNLGFSRGNNAGIRQAHGQYILLLNSDTEVRGDALWKMCDRMDEDVRIGALGARLLNPDDTVQLSCRSFPSYRTALFNRKSLLTRLFPNNRYSQQYLMSGSSHTDTAEVDWVIGACLMTRRETLVDVGLLDEEFFMYAEDVDWCYRMQQAGWKVVYFPEAEVMHHYEKSAGKAPFRMSFERHRSMWRFYKKHYSRDIVLVDLATILGITARFGLITTRDAFRGKRRK